MGALSVYLDASVLVALFTNDPFADRADLAFRARATSLLISDFAAAEFSSSIARHVRMDELSSKEARMVFSDFDAWTQRAVARVETQSTDIRTAEAILRRLDTVLRTPDALHIAIAQRIDAELATFDEKMATAARALGTRLAAI